MPGKSKHKRGKHRPYSKKGKNRQRLATTSTQRPVVAETREPVSPPTISPPRAGVPSPSARPAPIEHPYIGVELRTISILAGIMLIILIVLFFVLP